MNKLTRYFCCVLAAAALTQSARAAFTYTGGTLNAAQTYDGLGVDSALNTNVPNGCIIGGAGTDCYVGNGNLGNGSITVQSGTLTINASDFKVANAGAVATPP